MCNWSGVFLFPFPFFLCYYFLILLPEAEGRVSETRAGSVAAGKAADRQGEGDPQQPELSLRVRLSGAPGAATAESWPGKPLAGPLRMQDRETAGRREGGSERTVGRLKPPGCSAVSGQRDPSRLAGELLRLGQVRLCFTSG